MPSNPAGAAVEDWRSSTTASARYDNLQNIATHLQATLGKDANFQQEAFKIESRAFQEASSKAEYELACHQASTTHIPTPAADPSSESNSSPPYHLPDPPSSPGERIGPYPSCHIIGSGTTSTVYRSTTYALKVIHTLSNIEPHNPLREVKVLRALQGKDQYINLIETFYDQNQQLVLLFPYMPLTLSNILSSHTPLSMSQLRLIFNSLFSALNGLHEQGIIHRDIKPSALLFASPTGPIYLSDFGTVWHPTLSPSTEPPDQKILDIGTGEYRAPEVLFGKKTYDTKIDLWAAGVLLTECAWIPTQSNTNPPNQPTERRPLFESRPAHEDGSQLGLILSIFRTLGSPTPETWPEALLFRTPPFEMYRSFPRRNWGEILACVRSEVWGLVGRLLVFESGERICASEALTESWLCDGE